MRESRVSEGAFRMYADHLGWDRAQIVGRVTFLRRYPVKSMLGEDLQTIALSARGLHGDRTHAVMDQETGKVASVKHPRLWRHLLACAAECVAYPLAYPWQRSEQTTVRIKLPDGRVVLNTDPGVDDILSQVVGRGVSLASICPDEAELERAVPEEVVLHGVAAEVPITVGRLGGAAPDGTFFDYAPVHLITTATLGCVADCIPAVRLRCSISDRTS